MPMNFFLFVLSNVCKIVEALYHCMMVIIALRVYTQHTKTITINIIIIYYYLGILYMLQFTKEQTITNRKKMFNFNDIYVWLFQTIGIHIISK